MLGIGCIFHDAEWESGQHQSFCRYYKELCIFLGIYRVVQVVVQNVGPNPDVVP